MARTHADGVNPSPVDGGGEHWKDLLFQSPDPAHRKAQWKALLNRSRGGERHVTDADHAELLDALQDEPDGDVRSFGLLVLQQIKTAPPRGFGSAFWTPFGPERKAAVIAVNDKAHIKDVAPLVKLGRFFPSTSHPRMSFHTVSLAHPDWAPVRPESLDALCFVGRRTMFRNCVVLESLHREKGEDLGLRFTLPTDDHARRGGPLSAEFHQVCERRATGPAKYCTAQSDGRRVDYAAIQRLSTKVGGRRVTVLLVEGATSLGTCGAADWITSSDLEAIDPRDVTETSTLEILLEVTAVVHQPERPWEPQSVAKKIFVNGANIIAQTPRTVTIVIPAGQALDARHVRHVLLDDDEVEFGGERYEGLVALCLKSLRNQSSGKPHDLLPIDDLLDDASVWRSPWRPSFPAFFRDHLKRQVLREAISVNDKSARNVKLACQVILRQI